MNPFNRQTAAAAAQAQSVAFDAGLRTWMLKVYNYMASALILTGVVAYFASGSEAFLGLMFHQTANGGMGLSIFGWLVMLAPLGMVLYLSARLGSMSVQAAQTTFWVYAGVMGLSLSFIFLAYTGESIARTFFVTAGTFGAMSIVGYTTKRDLTAFGSFLIMGLIGIILASLVNIFVQSSGMAFVISILGVLIFTGLIAYDTQKLKHIYYSVGGNSEMGQKTAIMGALNLYMDFINLFIYLLRFMGNRR